MSNSKPRPLGGRFVRVGAKLGVSFFALLASAGVSPAAPLSLSLSARPADTTVARTNDATGIARWVIVGANDRLGFARSSADQSARAFLRSHASLFGLAAPDDELVLVRTDRDPQGADHLVYEQRYEGIPVFGTDLRVHMDADARLRSVSGVVIPSIALDTAVGVAVAAAETQAAIVVAKHHHGVALPSLAASSHGLVVFREGLLQGVPGPNRLAYRVRVSGGNALRDDVFVDAHTGVVLARYSLVHETLFRRLYENNPGNEIWSEGDGFPGFLDQWQQNELVAAGHAYNFFANAFGYVSYDDADAEMRTVNNDPTIDCPNANWNGSTANYCTGTASDDVVVHEWGHAYTQYTSNLIYYWQSGALNEAYSDIWGETVDLLNGYQDSDENLSLRTGCGSGDRWMQGEDASAFGGAIRDMWNPTCLGSPGKVGDPQYICSGFDSGGVHINSGVINHAFALLVDGGSYNGQTISALGFTKSAHIYWRAQALYQGQTTDFFAHADAVEVACNDLLGINLEGLSTTSTAAGPSGEIITLADCQEVSDAIAAVELRDPACPGVFQPLLDPDAPSLCNMEAPLDLLVQDFESGLGSWTVGQVPVNPGTWNARDWALTSSLPHGRAGSGVYGPDPPFGDCQSDLDNGVIYLQSPPINIPPGSPPLIRLAFDHYVSLEQDWDGGNLKYSTDGVVFSQVPSSAFIFNAYNATLNSIGDENDNPLASEAAFTGADGGSVAGSWGQSQINLNMIGIHPGDTVYLRWELGTDGCTGWDGWYVDDIRIYSCNLSSTTTTTTTLPAAVCPAAPAPGCRSAALPEGLGKSSVLVKDQTDDSKDRLKWKWSRGEMTLLGDFLNPAFSPASDYAVCVYDGSGGAQPVYEARVASQRTCDAKPCWKLVGFKAFKFKDRLGLQNSITDIKLKAGVGGKAQIQVKARGADLASLVPPLSPDVTVQLLAADGVTAECWETVFSDPLNNAPGIYRAKGP